MNDRGDALKDLTRVCREDPEAIAYILGYLGAHLPTSILNKTLDSWERHQDAMQKYLDQAHE